MIPARLSYRTRRLRLPRSRGPSPRNSVPAERRPAQECRRLTDPRRPGIAKDARTAPRYARTADKQRPLPLRLRRQCREPPRARKDRESGETKESSAPSRSHRRATRAPAKCARHTQSFSPPRILTIGSAPGRCFADTRSRG